jgi:hypothetical protein
MPRPFKATVNETLIRPPLRFKLVNGGVAGNFTITGIRTQDLLLSVLAFSFPASVGAVIGVNGDLTAEFTITAANTINNTGGTSSANGMLLVIYLASPTSADTI